MPHMVGVIAKHMHVSTSHSNKPSTMRHKKCASCDMFIQTGTQIAIQCGDFASCIHSVTVEHGRSGGHSGVANTRQNRPATCV